MALYREVSARIMQILRGYSDVFEEASIDEAYLDVSSLDSFADARERMMRLKRDVREREGLGCSVGIAPNKLIAKIASGRQKPDGLTVVEPEQAVNFLDPLPIRIIPGIGPKSERFLHEKNCRTVEELRRIPEPVLVEWFGKWGKSLFEKARGIDDSEVSNEWTRKSLGEQETFAENTQDHSIVAERLDRMAERIIEKLKTKDFKGYRTVTLTVRFGDFQTSNRSRSLPGGIAVDDDALRRLRELASSLILPFFDARENPRAKTFRLIGLRVEKLF
jgi:DNA polymerase IV (DinB-like DNA polymerase)